MVEGSIIEALKAYSSKNLKPADSSDQKMLVIAAFFGTNPCSREKLEDIIQVLREEEKRAYLSPAHRRRIRVLILIPSFLLSFLLMRQYLYPGAKIRVYGIMIISIALIGSIINLWKKIISNAGQTRELISALEDYYFEKY